MFEFIALWWVVASGGPRVPEEDPDDDLLWLWLLLPLAVVVAAPLFLWLALRMLRVHWSLAGLTVAAAAVLVLGAVQATSWWLLPAYLLVVSLASLLVIWRVSRQPEATKESPESVSGWHFS